MNVAEPMSDFCVKFSLLSAPEVLRLIFFKPRETTILVDPSRNNFLNALNSRRSSFYAYDNPTPLITFHISQIPYTLLAPKNHLLYPTSRIITPRSFLCLSISSRAPFTIYLSTLTRRCARVTSMNQGPAGLSGSPISINHPNDPPPSTARGPPRWSRAVCTCAP